MSTPTNNDTPAKKTSSATPERPAIETEVSRTDTSTVLEVSNQPGRANKAEHLPDDTTKFDPSEVEAALEEDEAGAPAGEQEDNGEAEQEAPEAAPVNDLPEYDPENEEVRAKYDARYFKEGGELNFSTLSEDYWASFKAVGGDESKAGMPEGTYAYLKDTLGLTKEQVKQIEKAQVALHRQEEIKAVSRVEGGVQRYNDAVKWAQEGGYTEAQRARFREEFAKGGDAQADAVDALMARFEKGSGAARRGPPRRASSPQRDATVKAGSGGTGPGGDVFKSKEEYTLAWRQGVERDKAAQQGNDRTEKQKARDHIDYLRRKARRSNLT